MGHFYKNIWSTLFACYRSSVFNRQYNVIFHYRRLGIINQVHNEFMGGLDVIMTSDLY